MLYPENIADKLGFTEVRRLLASYCLSPMGRERVEKMQFVTRAALLNRLLQQTAEFTQLLEDDSPFPASDYLDIRPWLHKIRPENAFLSLDRSVEHTSALQSLMRTSYAVFC